MKHRFTIKRILLNFFKLTLRPVLALMLAFLISNQASSQVNIIMNVTPGSVNVGQTFTVEVAVDFTSAGALNAVDVFLNFNPLDIEVVVPLAPDPSASATAISRLPSVTVGSLSSDSGPISPDDDKFNNIVYDNTLGHADHGRFRSAGTTSSDFSFFTVTFRALRVPPNQGLGAGVSPITFNTGGSRQSGAVNGLSSVLNPGPGGLVNSSVTITSGAACTLTSATVSNEATCDAQPFDLILDNVIGGTGNFDVVINGTTYTNIAEDAVITTITLPTYNIFDLPADVPVVPQNNDAEGGIEVGTRFTASVNGFIKGIRLYNGFPSPTGTYTGKLYANDGGVIDNGPNSVDKGVPLATANFASFSSVGWQQVLFSSPVPITAGTVYVATYFSSVGNYAKTNNYFQSSGHTNSNSTLEAPVSGLDPEPNGNANGLFTYENNVVTGAPAAPGFPQRTFNGGGYFVDVLFSPATTSYIFTQISETADPTCFVTGSQTLNVTSVDCSTLPVTLLNFSATPQGNKISLKWATASEDNNRGFDIQRSTDGVNWTTIGFVAGTGNSSFTKNYSYVDGNLAARRYYYKLKQIDFDERFKYSAIVSATLNGKREYLLEQNYPNPTNGETTIKFTLAKAEKVNLSLFDVSGRVVKVIVNGSKDEGTHAIPVNVGSLTRGVYYYRIQAGDFTDVKKLTIQ